MDATLTKWHMSPQEALKHQVALKIFAHQVAVESRGTRCLHDDKIFNRKVALLEDLSFKSKEANCKSSDEVKTWWFNVVALESVI
ncbi:hypothetical protein OUZ56_019829 [Daphnia magna]|uniref:Uncharacterized protein n=1 Tax=Daphnia magna TaxID=35525 RepID=A0ABQ9ZCS9_9CRUS|nr:hypothetical protein OUZ56_019829 [Daphnia magna]